MLMGQLACALNRDMLMGQLHSKLFFLGLYTFILRSPDYFPMAVWHSESEPKTDFSMETGSFHTCHTVVLSISHTQEIYITYLHLSKKVTRFTVPSTSIVTKSRWILLEC